VVPEFGAQRSRILEARRKQCSFIVTDERQRRRGRSARRLVPTWVLHATSPGSLGTWDSGLWWERVGACTVQRRVRIRGRGSAFALLIVLFGQLFGKVFQSSWKNARSLWFGSIRRLENAIVAVEEC